MNILCTLLGHKPSEHTFDAGQLIPTLPGNENRVFRIETQCIRCKKHYVLARVILPANYPPHAVINEYWKKQYENQQRTIAATNKTFMQGFDAWWRDTNGSTRFISTEHAARTAFVVGTNAGVEFYKKYKNIEKTCNKI